jgi:hypothetical protein
MILPEHVGEVLPSGPAFLEVSNPLTESDGEFGPKDGFALCIDGARFIPPNLCLTNITVTALDVGLESQGTAQMTGLCFTSPGICPSYAFRHIYRSPPYDATTTLSFRVAGLDRRTLKTVILGYAQMPAFRDRNGAQPTRPDDPDQVSAVWLNEGAFQLPLHLGAPSAKKGIPFTADGVRKFPPVPCATLLVRLENLSDAEEEGAGVLASGPEVAYDITVWTGNQDEADTDAPVLITLFGPKGRTGPHVLEDDDPTTNDEFGIGSVDTFRIEAPDVGPLRHIRIGHESTDGWFLRQVTVARRDIGHQWLFSCYRWLDVDKDDLVSFKTLTPSVGPGGIDPSQPLSAQVETFGAREARLRAMLPRYEEGIYDSARYCGQPLENSADAAMYARLETQGGTQVSSRLPILSVYMSVMSLHHTRADVYDDALSRLYVTWTCCCLVESPWRKRARTKPQRLRKGAKRLI